MAAALKACAHQVGGHMKKDATPDTLVDDAGCFYKPYQADARNEREAAFYRMVYGDAGCDITGAAQLVRNPSSQGVQLQRNISIGGHIPVAPPPPGASHPDGLTHSDEVVNDRAAAEKAAAAAIAAVDGRKEDKQQQQEEGDGATPQGAKAHTPAPWGVGEVYGPSQGPCRPEDIEGLKPFLPKFFGVAQVDGRQYMVMQDVCQQYEQPCVLDAKVGFTTTYTWADDKYQQKTRTKDAATTQTAVGFRISGLQAFKLSTSTMDKVDRQWGRELTVDTIRTAFTRFGSNDVLTPEQVFKSPQGALPQLRQLREWFVSQRSLQFFQASVLITYEGTARTMDDARVQVHLIDFAHTFPTNGAQDTNFLRGLESLIKILEEL